MIEQPEKIAEGLAAITIRPGDRLIIRAKENLKPETYARIAKAITEALPDVRTIVLDGSLEALVLRGPSSLADAIPAVDTIDKAQALLLEASDYIQKAKQAAGAFCWSGRPLPEAVAEMRSRIAELDALIAASAKTNVQ